MIINFIIPNIPSKPTGGYKIMYEYANQFALGGHDVCVYHVATIKLAPYYRLPHWIRIIRTLVCYPNSKPNWFSLDKRIKTKNVPYLKKKYLRDADVTITTMWATVLELDSLDLKGIKVNLIQGYETWFGDVTFVHKSFFAKMVHVVISDYLANVFSQITNDRAYLLPNPIEDKFCVKIDPKNRDRTTVAMLYSAHSYKGSDFGVEALIYCKKSLPSLKVKMFGTLDRPDKLPQWIEYVKTPKDVNEIYNGVAVFVSPSINDGWDLPCTEAMKCGCALVCTNIAGHTQYAKDGNTALLAQPYDSKDLADKIIKVIDDDDLRFKLVENGIKEVEKYTMQESYKRFCEILLKSQLKNE